MRGGALAVFDSSQDLRSAFETGTPGWGRPSSKSLHWAILGGLLLWTLGASRPSPTQAAGPNDAKKPSPAKSTKADPDPPFAKDQNPEPLLRGQAQDQAQNQAQKDLEVILAGPSGTAQGKNYGAARQRLLDHPKQSAALCQKIWPTLEKQPQNPREIPKREIPKRVQQSRILEIWSEVDATGAARAMGSLLQKEWRRASEDEYIDCRAGSAFGGDLCQSLHQLGSAAASTWLALGADSQLNPSARALALQALAESAPPAWIESMLQSALGPQSLAPLRESLLRALLLRAHQDPSFGLVLANALSALGSAGLSSSPQATLPAHERGVASLDQKNLREREDSLRRARAWVWRRFLRYPLRDPQKNWLWQRLQSVSTPWIEQIAINRLLAQSSGDDPRWPAQLERWYAAAQNPPARSAAQAQRQLIESLKILAPARSAQFIAQHPLREQSQPELAALAWRYAKLPPNAPATQKALLAAVQNPWPAPARASLDRIQAPCPAALIAKVQHIAGPLSRGGRPEREVRRAAIDALGRCASPRAQRALKKLADRDAIDFHDRARALRRFVQIAPPNQKSANTVERILGTAPHERARAAYFRALSRLRLDLSQAPPKYLQALLCAWAQSQKVAIQRSSGREAQAALRKLWPQDRCEAGPLSRAYKKRTPKPEAKLAGGR